MVQSIHFPTIPVRLNLCLIAAVLLMNLWQMLVLPLYILPLLTGWQIMLLLLLYLACTPLHWALLHEAIHRHLHPNRRMNELLGRFLAIPLFASFYLLQFGHLMHHRFNRKLGHEYYYLEQQSTFRVNLRYYYQLFIGLYLFEIMASLLVACLPRKTLIRHYHRNCKDAGGSALPELEQAGHHFFFRRNRICKTRIDVAAIILLLGGVCYAYVDYMLYFAGLFLGRGFIISFHDNVYHYGTPSDNSKAAKELYLSPILAHSMLYFNYHHTHHRYPQLAWHQLPLKHKQSDMEYDQSFGKALFEQCKGMKLWYEYQDNTIVFTK